MFSVIIPIRKGSKGLPGKNIRLLGNKPLYRHTLDQAIAAGAEKIVISTDIPEVLTASHPECVTLLPRPENLCADTTTMAPVIVHAIESCKLVGTIVLMQATSPLRRVEHIKSALELFLHGDFESVMTVTKADSGVLKWGTLDGDRFEPLRDISYSFANRQFLPDVFKPNGAVYVMDAGWFLKRKSFETKSIGVVHMSAEDSQDIDTLSDLEKCEFFLTQRNLEPNDENREP